MGFIRPNIAKFTFTDIAKRMMLRKLVRMHIPQWINFTKRNA